MLNTPTRSDRGPSTGRRTRSLLVLAAAVIGIILGTTSGSTTAHAGEISPYNVTIYLGVVGPDAADVMNGLTIEFWASGATEPLLCSNDPEAAPWYPPVINFWPSGCLDVPEGDYTLGIDGVPAGFSVIADCTSATAVEVQPSEIIDGASFTVVETYLDPASCDVTVVQPTVLVDKVVVGGAADTDDFTIEVYPAGGGSPIATGVDPSPESCLGDIGIRSITEPGTPDCAVIGLAAGDYQLGEITAPGYLPTNVGCTPYFGTDNEAFPDGIGEFSLVDSIAVDGVPVIYCEVTNTYSEGSVAVTKQVINDDGGTATAADFTAEVYAEGGALVTSGDCAADGSCIDTDLPSGDYRIGESGPAGYEATVACSRTGGSVPEIGTVVPSIPLPGEAIAGADAAFALLPDASVTCVITNNDIAPTTTIDPSVGILPPTGSGNRTATVFALGLLTLGGTLVALRRRTV